jgi:hypothetical protein
VRLDAVPEPGGWARTKSSHTSARTANVWAGNIARILADDYPTFAGVSPRTWMKWTDYPDRLFGEALRAFAAQREELIGTLEALTPDGWGHSVAVTLCDERNKRTLRSCASQFEKHERGHVRQIGRAPEPTTGRSR